MFKKLRAKWRLKLIDKAIRIKLMPRQRAIALNPSRPEFDYTWGRCSGKSVAAAVWTLMWRKDTISLKAERIKLDPERAMLMDDKLPAIPDPDATNYIRLDYLLRTYIAFMADCTMHGIQVATVTDFPGVTRDDGST